MLRTSAHICIQSWSNLEIPPYIPADLKKGDSLRETMRRIRKSVIIPFKKSEFEKQLKNLRDLNSDLSLQRSYMKAFQQLKATTLRPELKQAIVPRHYHAVRNAAQTLHEALITAWCCTDLTHSDHCAKLCLDSHVESGVRVSLDMVISYHNNQPDTDIANSGSEPPVWLYVKSTTANSKVDESLCRARATVSEPTSATNNSLLDGQSLCKTSARHGPDVYEERTVKRRKLGVRFASDTIESSALPTEPKSEPNAIAKASESTTATMLDLGQTKSVCEHLRERSCCTPDTSDDCHHCIGYLEMPKNCKHMFYCPGPRNMIRQHLTSAAFDTSYSLADLLTSAPEENFEADDRLKLAHRLSMTLLQFHSTPWLHDEWHIENFHLFGAPNHVSDTTLRSLHLDALFPNCRERLKPLPMEGVTEQPAVAKPRSSSYSISDIYYGIRNMTLFSLGVALLQIGQWRPLRYADTDDPIVTVRKMARGPMQLGSKYREIVRCA